MIRKIIGAALVSSPSVALSALMVHSGGWALLALVWSTVLLVFLVMWTGITLLMK